MAGYIQPIHFRSRRSLEEQSSLSLVRNGTVEPVALSDHPDLDQLKRQAKDLLKAFLAGEPEVSAEVKAYYDRGDPTAFSLHDAQLVIARSYGFER